MAEKKQAKFAGINGQTNQTSFIELCQNAFEYFPCCKTPPE